MLSRKLSKYCAVLINLVLCDCSGIFHVGSEFRLSPDAPSTYFGYSIVLTPKNVFVGAPKGRNGVNTTVSSGVVFSCDLRGKGSNNVICSPLHVSNVRRKQASYFSQETMDTYWQDDMWFGATIAVVPDDNLMICAPRWWQPFRKSHQLVQGLCYVQNSEEKRPKLSRVFKPLGDDKRQAFLQPQFPVGSRKEYSEFGHHINYYAYGQTGTSISVVGNTVILGAPGLMQWTGGIVHLIAKPETKLLTFEKQLPANTYYTRQLGPDDYFGYSVEAAVFQTNGSMLFVSGAPRSKLCYGQVLIFEPPLYEQVSLKVRASLRGPQLGSYFGASLCCADIDADGRVDLLVGAPNFVKRNEVLPYDQGAVFVYLNRVENTTDFILEDAGYVTGSGVSGARFGTAIVDIGDVDGDGFTDIAIGAPYESEGQGAVYIYGGSATGLKSTYSQRIVVANTGGFGISISKGVDIDGNNCNDFAVGAHESGTAHIFRCIPTMKVVAAIKVPDAVDLPENASNFTVIFCVTTDLRKKWPKHKIYLSALISVDNEENRAELSGAEEYNIAAEPGAKYCKEEIVVIKSTAGLSTPIPIKFDLQVIETMKDGDPMFNPLGARVSEDSVMSSELDIQVTRDCGSDLICRPWLTLDLQPLDSMPYIPGLSRTIGLKVTVTNEEEPAFGANVHLILPLPPKRVPSDCTLRGMNLTCGIAAPLMRNEREVYEIEMDYILNLTDAAAFIVTGLIEDPLDNGNISEAMWSDLTLYVTPKANFSVTGQTYRSLNRTIPVSRKALYEADSVTIAHYYEIINYGPSDWSQFRSVIQIPKNTEKTNDKRSLTFCSILFPCGSRTLKESTSCIYCACRKRRPRKSGRTVSVSLTTLIEGCHQDHQESDTDGVALFCVWSAPVNVTLPVVVTLRFDLHNTEAYLEEVGSLNITTSLSIDNHNKSATVQSTLVLDPAPPVWPLVVGIIGGILLLAAIVAVLYKCGFFSRQKREDLKLLQTEELSSDLQLPEMNQSLQELIDSDDEGE